jgi:ABC-type phosphate/phosphonate transport system substrate-binding protein
MKRLATNGHAYYSVAPRTDTAWRDLLTRVAEEAGIAFEFVSYPLPQSLEELWTRADLGCVFIMCGYPISLRQLHVVPIAAPIPLAPWARGRAMYRTDLVVKADSGYRRLSDTFGGRIGWTARHSHSGYNALRHHLLQYRTPQRPRLYSQVVGGLGTVRKVFDAVLDGVIDVGPVDAYWHMLMQLHHPDLAGRVRVLESTATAPMPAFVANPSVPTEAVDHLVTSFQLARDRAWFRPLAAELVIEGFMPVRNVDAFSIIQARARQAEEADYPAPE